jgi:hypothetical protein
MVPPLLWLAISEVASIARVHLPASKPPAFAPFVFANWASAMPGVAGLSCALGKSG